MSAFRSSVFDFDSLNDSLQARGSLWLPRAPAIVHAENIMPVKQLMTPTDEVANTLSLEDYAERILKPMAEKLTVSARMQALRDVCE